MAVDVEGFGRRTDTAQVRLRTALYSALERAMEDAGVRSESCRFDDRGDGVLILIPSNVPKNRVLAEFVPSLVALLHEHNVGRDDRLRLRIAIHAGEVVHDQYGVTGGAVLTAMRLLDSAEMRTALQFASADLV